MSTWRNKSMTVKLDGFDELLSACAEAGRNAEVEGKKCFDECQRNIYFELFNNAKAAGLPARLRQQMSYEVKEPHKGLWWCEIGWKKQRPSTENPLPDTYKVMFFNYGTPSTRFTKAGYSRGKETAHPVGSHGFIKKAKIGASRKNKAIIRKTLAEILKGLKK